MGKTTYRMLAIDLDGTLLGPDGQVSVRNRQAVRRALDAGLLVCFATGRNWTESKLVLEAVEHYDTAVFVGGAIVMDLREGKVLHHTMMQPKLAAEVCTFLEARGHAALALQDTLAAGVDYLISAQVPLNPATRNWMEAFALPIRFVPDLGRYKHPHTIRVGMVADDAAIADAEAALKRHFGQRIVCQSLLVPAARAQVLEAFDPAVNKWAGILHVAGRHGVQPAEIVAIGDDVNDLPMIANAGLGVAMGNAKPQVRQAAGRVIGHNHQDGLAAFIEELIETQTVRPIRQHDAA